MVFKHKGSMTKTIQIAPEHLDQIQDAIHLVLRENAYDESFSRFQSFFFTLQILGIKLSTSLDEGWEGLWDHLVSRNEGLDWDYIGATNSGELLLDIGFGFHPPKNSELVGFWDLDAIRQGFDYGGYARGTSHTVSTVSAIGGIHAEMTSE